MKKEKKKLQKYILNKLREEIFSKGMDETSRSLLLLLHILIRDNVTFSKNITHTFSKEVTPVYMHTLLHHILFGIFQGSYHFKKWTNLQEHPQSSYFLTYSVSNIK